jgi:hypothetical protein
MKKQKHIPFKKPFYKLLGVSVLSLGLLYGGLVWAFDLSGAQNCIDDSTQCVGVAPVGNGSQSWRESGILQDGKTLKITNTGDSAQFVPLRSATERTSLFQAKNAGNEKLGELDICQPGLGSTIPSVFGNGIMGCDDASIINCSSSCTGGSWNTPATGSCSGIYEAETPATTCTGTYDVIKRTDPWGNSFNWELGTVYFIMNIGQSSLNDSVPHGAYSNGGSPGSYDIASSGVYSGCASYYVENNEWYESTYSSGTDQFDTRCFYYGGATGSTSPFFSDPYTTISTNNSCTNVPLNQCGSNQYYAGCVSNASSTTRSCDDFSDNPQDCEEVQFQNNCQWNWTTQAQTYNCNTNNTESTCEQANAICNWSVDQICLNTNICLNPNTTQAECNNNQACSWSTVNSRCHLDTQGCYFDQNQQGQQVQDDQQDCENEQGCFWYQNEYCMEQTQECYGNDTESVCNNTQGCYWDLFCRNDL